MVDAEGSEIAVKRIEKAVGGCLIEERWSTADGLSGASFTYLDPGDGRWRQDRVDARGVVAHLEGTAQGGQLTLAGESAGESGEVVSLRLTLRSTDDGTVEQVIEESDGDGVGWTTFRSTYLPADRSTAAADLRADPTDETEAVRVLSRAAERTELAAGDRRQIPLTSPMILEVELGALDLFPEEARWRSDETAEYICDRVTVRQLGVAWRHRRGQVELELFATLHTAGRARRTELELELLDANGSRVAAMTIDKFKLGGQVPSYDAKTGLTRSATVSLEQETFDALFAGGRRPRVRVTVSVTDR